MSLHCEWFVLAERVLCDERTQQLTIVGCLEGVAAVRFPTLHHGFAIAARYRWVGEPATAAVRVAHRVVRRSPGHPDEEVATLDGEWAPGTDVGRVWINFHTLRLQRAERLGFRIDHRLDDGPWVEGPTTTLEVATLELPPEELERMRQELLARGLPIEQLE